MQAKISRDRILFAIRLSACVSGWAEGPLTAPRDTFFPSPDAPDPAAASIRDSAFVRAERAGEVAGVAEAGLRRDGGERQGGLTATPRAFQAPANRKGRFALVERAPHSRSL